MTSKTNICYPYTKINFPLPIYDYITNIIWSVAVFITTLTCFKFLCKVFNKKRNLKNEILNTSYCRISDQILTLLAINMVIYGIFIEGGVAFSWYTTYYCVYKESASEQCLHSRELQSDWFNWIGSINLITKLIDIFQIYEWISMKYIIIWQSTKDLTAAMLCAQDPKQMISFKRKEFRLKVSCLLISVIIIG